MLLTLFRYSTKDVKKYTAKIKDFGFHSFTNNDKKASKLNRLFFYVNNSPVEARFKNLNKYKATIDSSKLYDVANNPKQLKFNDINDLLKQVKKLGYLGIVYTTDDLHLANIFYDIEVVRC